jgi:catechol 2,3-dioxygenase-like lactoylglutathione lyase family enzyme
VSTATEEYGESVADMIGVAHLVLRVGDWRKSAQWYQNVLGFERHKGDGFSAFCYPGAPFALLFREAEEAPAPSSSEGQRLDHIALHVPSLAALEHWRDGLASQGIEVEIERQPVGASITLHDPDGLEVELFAPAAGSVLDVG